MLSRDYLQGKTRKMKIGTNYTMSLVSIIVYLWSKNNLESRDANNCGCVVYLHETERNLQTSSNIAISEILNDAVKPLNNNARKSRSAARIYSASLVFDEVALFLIYFTENFRNSTKQMYSSATTRVINRLSQNLLFYG